MADEQYHFNSGQCTYTGQCWEDEHAQTGYSTGLVLGLRLDLNQGELVAYSGGIRLGVLVSHAIVASQCSGVALMGSYCHTSQRNDAVLLIISLSL